VQLLIESLDKLQAFFFCKVIVIYFGAHERSTFANFRPFLHVGR